MTIISTKGYKYVRVCESYRNAGGKPRSRVIENHGRLDVLEAKDPDYVRKLRDRVKKDNEAARIAHAENLENTAQVRLRRLEQAKKPGTDYGFAETVNIGSALLRRVWTQDRNCLRCLTLSRPDKRRPSPRNSRISLVRRADPQPG